MVERRLENPDVNKLRQFHTVVLPGRTRQRAGRHFAPELLMEVEDGPDGLDAVFDFVLEV
jgi:hypothetical protein